MPCSGNVPGRSHRQIPNLLLHSRQQTYDSLEEELTVGLGRGRCRQCMSWGIYPQLRAKCQLQQRANDHVVWSFLGSYGQLPKCLFKHLVRTVSDGKKKQVAGVHKRRVALTSSSSNVDDLGWDHI